MTASTICEGEFALDASNGDATDAEAMFRLARFWAVPDLLGVEQPHAHGRRKIKNNRSVPILAPSSKSIKKRRKYEVEVQKPMGVLKKRQRRGVQARRRPVSVLKVHWRAPSRDCNEVFVLFQQAHLICDR